MASYLQLVATSRSQRIRIGRGAGNSLVSEINMGDLPVHPQSGNLAYAFYFNLADPQSRKDYRNHQAIGAVDSIGIDVTHASDFFATATVTATNSGLVVTVPTFTLNSRVFGGKVTAPQAVITVPANTSGVARTDAILVNPNGSLELVVGVPAPTNVYEVDTFTASATLTAGGFTLTFTYNGNTFTTATLPFGATAAQMATAVVVAGNLPGTLTGTGGPVSATGTPVILTASAGLQGPFSGWKVNPSPTLTGGTIGVVRTTPGVQGPVTPVAGGGAQVVCTLATTSSAAVPTSVIPTS